MELCQIYNKNATAAHTATQLLTITGLPQNICIIGISFFSKYTAQHYSPQTQIISLNFFIGEETKFITTTQLLYLNLVANQLSLTFETQNPSPIDLKNSK